MYNFNYFKWDFLSIIEVLKILLATQLQKILMNIFLSVLHLLFYILSPNCTAFPKNLFVFKITLFLLIFGIKMGDGM